MTRAGMAAAASVLSLFCCLWGYLFPVRCGAEIVSVTPEYGWNSIHTVLLGMVLSLFALGFSVWSWRAESGLAAKLASVLTVPAVGVSIWWFVRLIS
jgi:hypothetical protein